MLRNYLKVAFRYLSRHKGYTLINSLGLGVGIACCLLIMLFVKSEWSFDRFHSKTDRLYRAWMEEHYHGEVLRNTVTPIPLAPVLQAGLPEVEMSCRVGTVRPAVRYNGNTFSDPVNIVDSNFFSVFDFSLAEGNASTCLASKNSIVLTSTIAKKYFGSSEAVGKDLELVLGEDTVLFTVTAVAQDVRQESSLQFGMLIPFSNATHLWSVNTRTKGWSSVAVQSFLLLKKNASAEAANAKISSIMDPLVANNYKPGEYLVRLQPLKDIHFNSLLPADMDKPSDPKYSYIMSSIGLLILLIACINFVTLSVGRSASRALEVGVRKVLGAERLQIIRQFWGEAFLLTLLAMAIGVGLALLLQKPFNQLANRELSFSINGFTLLFCFLLMAFIGLLAGIYPAFILSNFRPIEVLKGKLRVGGIGFFRKGLIVVQFVASIVMIIGTFSVGRQLNYLRSKDLGYNREQVIVVATNQPRRDGNMLARRFKSAVEKIPSVSGVSASLYSMAEYGWMFLGYIDPNKGLRQFEFNAIDAQFLPVMNLKLVAGRNFSDQNPGDSNYVLVNEAMVKEYGWKDPVGQKLPGDYDQIVLGVVKDFNIESLHNTIKPAVLALKPDSLFARSSDVNFNASPRPRISVRFSGGDPEKNVADLKAAWKSVAGDREFDFRFLDEALNTAYLQEQRLGKIVEYASLLSIFVACMGLFGLATLVVVRRTKEIGIRKVLGANVGRIVVLLSKDFVVLVALASVAAFPLAWWALSQWLQDFAYRIDIPWIAFGGAVLLTLAVALLTVCLQAVRAALMNPVKSLRTE